jgi:hypothetical protein
MMKHPQGLFDGVYGRKVVSLISHTKYLPAPSGEPRLNFIDHILGYNFMSTMPPIKQLRSDLLTRQQEAMTPTVVCGFPNRKQQNSDSFRIEADA